MARHRLIFLGGAVACFVGLGWVFWGMFVGLQEINVTSGARTQTYEGVAIALVVIGILLMIASRYARKDK